MIDDICQEIAREGNSHFAQHHRDGTEHSKWREDLLQEAQDYQDRLRIVGQTAWVTILWTQMARAFFEEDETALRAELVKVAAVAATWIEDIDSRT